MDNKLVVHNNTDSTIAFLIPQEPNYFPTTDQPDTILEKKINDSLLDTRAKVIMTNSTGGVHFIKANSSENIGTFNTTWEGVIEQSPKKKIEFLFFPVRILTSGKYTWRQIWCDTMYIQKQVFSETELKKHNWVVEFNMK